MTNKSISDFGFKFVDGKLQDIETGGPFRYRWSGQDGQQKYEEFAEAITEHVYKLLEEEAGLTKIPIPVDAQGDEPRSFFFATPDAWTCEKLLILINGSGLVRAGQWSRKVIINQGLYEGSMLPYIHEAKKLGFGVMVMNTNENKVLDSQGVNQYVRGSEDPPAHAQYVWSEFVKKAKAKRIAIVAHSAGGYTTVRLADSVTEDFINRVFAVCFTDSAHIAGKSEGWEHLKKVARNWALSNKSLDTQLSPHRSPIKQVSAGTTKHDDTAYIALHSVFKFIKDKEAQLLDSEN